MSKSVCCCHYDGCPAAIAAAARRTQCALSTFATVSVLHT